MARDQYDVEVEKQRTKQTLVHVVFWLGFWFLMLGSCTAVAIWGGSQ